MDSNFAVTFFWRSFSFLVPTRIGAVSRRASTLIAGPVETNRIGVTLVCHGLLQPAADVAFGSNAGMSQQPTDVLLPIGTQSRNARFVLEADICPLCQ